MLQSPSSDTFLKVVTLFSEFYANLQIYYHIHKTLPLIWYLEQTEASLRSSGM
jgi:hypothetical protein